MSPRRVRISPMAAAALGPEVLGILAEGTQDALGQEAARIMAAARAQAPRTSPRFRSTTGDVLRVPSERLDKPRALPPGQ